MTRINTVRAERLAGRQIDKQEGGGGQMWEASRLTDR
jgi:hypothetical protein